MNNLTFGNARHQYYETLCGGAGAGERFDGASAVHTHMTNSRLTDPEILELAPSGARRVLHDPARLRRRGPPSRRRRRGAPPAVYGGARRGADLQPPARSALRPGGRRAGLAGRNRVLRADGSSEELAGIAAVELAPAIRSRSRPRAAAGSARSP
jgi:5-oxoprolinase (ATP-hydrolysing)